MDLTTTLRNVLLIEDTPDYASLVLRWLTGDPGKSEFSLVWTDSLASALARLKQGGLDIVLLDLGLPDSNGPETFATLRSAAPDLPVIILSGADSEALALQTIQFGAQDYLVKSSCTPELLIRALRHALVRHRAMPPLEPAKSSKPTRIVGVLGCSGGVGATTVAAVLAAEFRHHTDQSTLLMDLDSNPGLVAFLLGIEPQFTIQDALDNSAQLDRSMWEGLVTRRPGNLDILAAPKTVREGEVNFASLRNVVGFAAENYRWIVMDLGRLNQTSAQLLRLADDVMLVSTESIPALHQCKRTIELIHELGVAEGRLQLILNHKHEGEQLPRKEIENLFGIPIEASLPPAHDDLHAAYLKKQLPRVNGDFRLALTAVARKMAGLPEESAKRGWSLNALKARFQPKSKTNEESIAS